MSKHPNHKVVNKRLTSWQSVLEDFSAAPFRLFFLTASVVGILAATCWTWAMLGWWWVPTDPLNLHIFLFLQGLAGLAYAGFLFTAIPEWTHNNVNLRRLMQPLWCLCMFAIFVASVSLRWGLTIMIVYWLCVLSLAVWLIWQKRDHHQMSVLLFVAATLLMTLYLTSKAWHEDLAITDWQQLFHIEVLGIALIHFRIGKALGTQALEDDGQSDSIFIPNPFYKNLAVWLFYLLIAANLLTPIAIVEGWLNLAIAGVMLGRLREWHFVVLLKRHYVRWLYLTLFMIGIGYAWRGIALIEISDSPFFNPVLALHLIAIGGLVLMIYEVFNIAGLRHSQQALVFPWTSRLGLMCILLAAVSRSVAVGLGANYLWFAIYLPGILLASAFILYVPVFYVLFLHNEATIPD